MATTKYEQFPGMSKEEMILFDILREIEFLNTGGGGGSGSGYTGVVANYSALPSPASAVNQFYFVKNSQGTAWLPGSLGGTYYPAGSYYSDGTGWYYGLSPYQATQSDVNAGVITDQFVSPATLKGWISGTGPGNKLNTGVLTYNGATQASTTQVNIGAATGWVVNNETNPSTPTQTYVNYVGASNVTVPTLGTGIASYIMLKSDGTIQFQNTFPTSAERKSMIYLSKIGHPSGVITTVGDEPDFILSPLQQFRDFFQAINYVNNGVGISANGANLNLNLSTGVITGDGVNFVADNTKPNEYTVSAATTISFLRRTRTGAGGGFTTLLDPANYDVAGTITAIGGGSNTSTLQYVYYVPPLGVIIQYGQTTYTSLNGAITAIGKENPVIYPSLIRNAILIGVIAVTRSATSLNDTTQAQFFPASKFGEIIGSVGGTSTGTLQTAYNNSLIPQITTSSTLGAVTFQRGSGADTDAVHVIQNGAAVNTFTINGNGTTLINTGSNTTSINGFTVSNTTFNPTSGSNTYTNLLINPTYNQTSTANGIIRGIYYNPTLAGVLGEHYFINASSGKVSFTGATGGEVASITLTGGSTTNSSETITVASTTGINAGDYVTGTNIPAGALIKKVLSSTQFKIIGYATGTGSSLTFTVFPRVKGINTSYSYTGTNAFAGLYIENTASSASVNDGLLIRTTTAFGTGIRLISDSANMISMTNTAVATAGNMWTLQHLSTGEFQINYNDINATRNWIFSTSGLQLPGNSPTIFINNSGTAIQIAATGQNGSSVQDGIGLQTGNLNQNQSTGTVNVVKVGSSGFAIAPVAGTTEYHMLGIFNTINQTGTSSGKVVGVYYNPVTTAVLGTHNAWESTSGQALFTQGTGSVLINSNNRIISTAPTGSGGGLGGLQISGTGTGAQDWVFCPTSSSTLLLARPGLRLALFDANGSFAVGSLGGDLITNLSVGLSVVPSNVTVSGSSVVFANAGTQTLNTSGTYTNLQIGASIISSSNAANFTNLLFGATINQTGTASGIIRGLYYNPTVISILGTHNAWESTSGNIVIGGTNSVVLQIQNNGSTAATALGSTASGVLSVGAGFVDTTIRSTTNSAEIMHFKGVASAVNYIQLRNSATGAPPIFEALGSDSNININFTPRGTGTFVIGSGTNSTATDNILLLSNSLTSAGDSTLQHYAFVSGGSTSNRSVIQLAQPNTSNQKNCNTYIWGKSTAITAGGSEATQFGIDVTIANVRTNLLTLDSSGLLLNSSDLKLTTVGNGIYVKEGSNATMGTATLVAGTKVVSTTKVTANSRIYLTTQSLGTVTTPKEVAVTARTAGTSFTITSADATDTSVVAWVIIEPS